jgi:hypothetical protein
VTDIEMPPFEPDSPPVEPPPPVEPDPQPIPDDFRAEFPCPKCDKVFPSKIALQGHQNVHRTPPPCPECGKQYSTPGALGNHRKTEHGNIGPWAEKNAAKRRRNGEEDPIEMLTAVEAKKKQAREKKAEQRSRSSKTRINPEWQTDDIFQSVVESLWSGGSVPVRCILPLMQWREATREFLEKVQSE